MRTREIRGYLFKNRSWQHAELRIVDDDNYKALMEFQYVSGTMISVLDDCFFIDFCNNPMREVCLSPFYR